MFAKQLTVFIENRTGRLSEVLNVLKTSGVNILSLSLADTTEFGLLRLIVDNPELGREKLIDGGFSSLLSNVSIIKIPHKVGALQELLGAVDKNGVNIATVFVYKRKFQLYAYIPSFPFLKGLYESVVYNFTRIIHILLPLKKICHISIKLVNLDSLLLHSVTVTNCNGLILKCIKVNCDTYWSTDFVLTAVTLTD